MPDLVQRSPHSEKGRGPVPSELAPALPSGWPWYSHPFPTWTSAESRHSLASSGNHLQTTFPSFSFMSRLG